MGRNGQKPSLTLLWPTDVDTANALLQQALTLTESSDNSFEKASALSYLTKGAGHSRTSTEPKRFYNRP